MMATPTIIGDKLFICPGCQRGGFKSLNAVKSHFETKGHKVSCIPCDKSFGSIIALLKHSQTHEKPTLLEGSDPKTLKPAKPAKPSQKSTKNDMPQDHVKPIPIELADPVSKSKKSKKSKQAQDPAEPISVKPVELAPTSKKSKKSQEHPVPVPVKPAKPAPKSTHVEKPRDRTEVPSTNPAEPVPKSKKSKKSKARSEPLPAKAAEPATKHVSNEPSSHVISQRPEVSKDLWDTSIGHTSNPNYHAILEPLEQDLIFRYLSARCHSDTRLATRGFTLRAGLTEKNKRPSRRPPPKTGHFRQAPRYSVGLPKRRAIVLDCEMVQVEEGRRELAYLTAIDFLTGEVIIDNYVQPKSKVVNWDSRYSGVTCLAMNKAVKKGTALHGWEAARSKLWQFMDSETVLIGHSLNNDLDVLGLIHWNIVDSSIITSEAVFYTVHATEPLNRTWSLKTLASELVDYDIQVGKQGHSALEDARATRDIVIWCLRYPEHLKVWADNAREQEAVRVYERELKKTTEEEVKEQKRKNEMEFKWQMITRDLPGLDIDDIDLSDDEPIDATDSSGDDFNGDGLKYERVSIEAAAVSFF